MFRPRHTLESLASELAHGLREGSILLHPDESTPMDVEDFESMMRTTLAKYRRRESALLLLSLLAAASGTAIALLQVLTRSEGVGLALGPSNGLVVGMLSTIVGAFACVLMSFKTREKSIELKTCIRILKLADPTTARRLVLRVAPRLRSREIVP